MHANVRVILRTKHMQLLSDDENTKLTGNTSRIQDRQITNIYLWDSTSQAHTFRRIHQQLWLSFFKTPSTNDLQVPETVV